TRSSQSTTAILHDFALGQVDLCSASVSTSASPSGNGVLAGTSVSDTATVNVLTGGGPTPTGTIDFFLCQPSQVTTGGCEGTAGTKIGATKTLVGGTITSDSTNTTTAIGKYCWRAVYTPVTGSPYTGSSHTNALTVASATDTPECFVTLNPTTLLSFSDQIVGL